MLSPKIGHVASEAGVLLGVGEAGGGVETQQADMEQRHYSRLVKIFTFMNAMIIVVTRPNTKTPPPTPHWYKMRASYVVSPQLATKQKNKRHSLTCNTPTPLP